MSKPTLSITAAAIGNVASVRITDAIQEGSEYSAATVRNLVDGFLAQGLTRCELYINSKGGDCFEADEMCNDLDRFGRDNVAVKLGAVCASAATIFMAKYKTTAQPNTMIMIHKPRLGVYGDISKIAADTVLLQNKTNDYRAAYAAKTGMAPAKIDELWQADYWMSAPEALRLKFIDAIATGEPVRIEPEPVTMLAASLTGGIPAARAGWSYDDWQEKDWKGLEALADSNPVAFNDLFNRSHGTNLKPIVRNNVPAAILSAGFEDKLQPGDVRANWTYNDYQEKDYKALARIAHHMPGLFDALFKASL